MNKDLGMPLEQHEAFSRMGPDFIQYISDRGEFISRVRDEVICREGGLADYLYFLFDGAILLAIADQKIINLHGLQGHFGWNRFETKYPVTATVESETALLFRIHREILNSLFNKQKSLSEQLYSYCIPLGAHLFFRYFNLQNFILAQEDFLTAFQFESFKPNSMVVNKGSRADRFFIIVSGSAKITINDPTEPEKVVNQLGPGSYFGEVALLDQRERGANVIAKEELATFSLPYDAFNRFLSDNRGQFVKKYLKEGIKKYSAEIDDLIIGSDPECNVHIYSNNIAPRQARLIRTTRKDGSVRYSVKPLISTSVFPVYVNRQLIDKETRLSDNDELFLSNFRIVINVAGNSVSVQEIDYYALLVENVCFEIKDKVVIDHVSFPAESHELVCIMGPSGSGKTTLLDLISGSKKQTSGNIQCNNDTLYKNLDFYRDKFGIIPQDDVLFSELTVFENLYFAAKLRDPMVDKHELDRKISVVLKRLKLLDKKHARVGSVEQKGLSGGERKRVNIARELVFGPHILFIDEPTSGLSSKDSEEIITLLREIANSGKLVFVVLHQPGSKIFKMFDRIILLDKGGKLAYTGPVIDCIRFMQEADNDQSPAECTECGICQPELIFEILEKRDHEGQRKFTPDYWKQRFQDKFGHRFTEKKDKPSFRSKKVSIKRKINLAEDIRQLALLVHRTFLVKGKDINNLLVSLGAPTCIALLMGFVLYYSPEKGDYSFYQNKLISIYLFIAVIFSVFIGLTNSVRDIVSEQAIFDIESKIRLRIRWYVLSKFIVLAFFAAVQVAVFLLICNFMLGIDRMFMVFFPHLYLATIFGISLGLFLSSFARTPDSVVNWIPLVLIPQIILGGALIKFEDINKSQYLSSESLIPVFCQVIPSRWAHESIFVAQATHNPRDSALQENIRQTKTVKAEIKELRKTGGDEARISVLQTERSRLRKEKAAIEVKYPYRRYQNEQIEDAVMDANGKYIAYREKYVEEHAKVNFFFVSLYDQKKAAGKEPGFWFLGPFYSEYKGIFFRHKFFEIKTMDFNAIILCLLTVMFLVFCMLVLRIKRHKHIYV